MKSRILLIAVSLLVFTGKTQVLDNTGPIQIGKTTTTLFDSLMTHGYVFKVSNNWEEHFNAKGKNIYKIEHGPGMARRFDGSTLVMYHENFKIGKLTLWGIEFENVELEFYKDTLVSFVASYYPTELKQLLIKKFGQPKIGVDKVIGNCIENGDTSTMTYETFTYSDSYMVKGIVIKSFNDSCIKKFDYSFIANKPSVVASLKEKELYEIGKL